MLFKNMTSDPPEGLATEDFILRPIVAADAERDYAAVMESRVPLRTWEQTTWPADDFTVEANREDLEMLERRHANREAFTYTVLDPARPECLGCVYFMPPDARSFTRSQITPAGDHRWEDVDAAVYFWVRTSRLADQTDRKLLDALRSWISREWSLGGPLFITNEQFTQQVDMFEQAGLQVRFTIAEPDKPGLYLAYE